MVHTVTGDPDEAFVRTAGAGRAEGVVSIGNKGTRSGNFTPEFGLLRVQQPAMTSQRGSSPACQCHVPHHLWERVGVEG